VVEAAETTRHSEAQHTTSSQSVNDMMPKRWFKREKLGCKRQYIFGIEGKNGRKKRKNEKK
jgi:hypothetical protein